jgi:hypothetical protein
MRRALLLLILPGIAIAALLAPPIAAAQAEGSIAGKVLDAVTEAPVASAAVIASAPGQRRWAVTDAEGRFRIALPAGSYSIEVERPGYVRLAAPAISVKAGVVSNVVVKAVPAVIAGEMVEIEESTYEQLQPSLLRQEKFAFSSFFLATHRGQTLRGEYRVCVARDGRVTEVIPMQPAGDADPVVREGIRKGWQYRPLPRETCFAWRVTLRLGMTVDRRELLPPADSRE